jgi:hypothetical protein
VPTPSVGRIVHYQSFGTPKGEYRSECRAAMITAPFVTDPDIPALRDTVSLAVFNPDGIFLKGGIHYDENKAGGTWHWPEML